MRALTQSELDQYLAALRKSINHYTVCLIIDENDENAKHNLKLLDKMVVEGISRLGYDASSASADN